jgi:hypothetical protein
MLTTTQIGTVVHKIAHSFASIVGGQAGAATAIRRSASCRLR